MQFIGSPWPTITAELRKAKTRTAVTAYLTSSAEKMLPLKGKHDRLFVDASPGTVAAGLTDPNVIERFMERKVRCYSVEGLHAKVYLADGVMFCGSPNATANSSSGQLEEACVRVKNASLISEFEGWLAALRWERIDDVLLEQLKTKYKPPKWRPGHRGAKKSAQAQSWITWTQGEHESEDVDDYVERLAEAEGLDAEEIYYVTTSANREPARLFKEARRGDEVFIIDHDDAKRLYEPVRVIAPSEVVGDRRVLALEWGEDSVTFRRLLREALAAGMNLPESGKTEHALSRQKAAALRKMFLRAT